jgi:hypothetical protein
LDDSPGDVRLLCGCNPGRSAVIITKRKEGGDLPAEERIRLLRELESARETRIVSYVTGDRSPGLETRIGADVFPFFYEVLTRIGKQDRLDLLVYSTGGATMAAWGIVNLLREFADRLSVLVPFKAHSSATLIALGADEIIMSRMGQLSPVDPTVTSPFNPTLPNQTPGAPPQFLPVSVEDVVAFLDLLKEEAKVAGEDNITEMMKTLAGEVPPLALGSVYRAKKQIAMLATNLLNMHMSKDETDRVEKIVKMLTREFYSHDYLIGRKEAKERVGLKINDCSEGVEQKMMSAMAEYRADLELDAPYHPEAVLAGQNTRVVSLDRAFIESADRTYVFRTRREIKRVKTVQQGVSLEGFQEKVLQEGWQMDQRKKQAGGGEK